MNVHKYKLREFLSRSVDEDTALVSLINSGSIPTLGEFGPWIAGGMVRRSLQGEKKIISDVDLFFSSAEQLAQAKGLILTTLGGSVIDERNSTLSMALAIDGKDVVIQLIGFRFFASIVEVLDSFDFTICQCGTDGTHLYVGEFTLWDIARKRLALHRLTYGTATIRRLIKYTRQGFTACSGVMSDILERSIAEPSTVHREIDYID